MTRVLWVSPTISSAFGGPTTTTVNGLLAETQAGCESSLISTISSGDETKVASGMSRLTSASVDVKLFPRTRLLSKGEAWGFSPRMAVWMFRNLRKFDIVHLQYVWCMSSVWGSILGKLFGIPVVVTPHESLTDYDIDVASRSRIKRRIKLGLRRLYLHTIDRLIFMSDLERRDTRSGSVAFTLISHAVQEEAVVVRSPEVSRDDQPLRIGFLGRNIPKKGIDLIIAAMGRNRSRGWTLSIAGPPGTDEFVAEIRDQAEQLGITAEIAWLGFLEDSGDLFDNCDVLAMPSAYEGFGMVAGEAMCRGVPVIVPRRSGVAEIVAEFNAGIVMPESSVDEVEKALVTMAGDAALRQRFGENGLEAANSRLTYSAYAAATVDLYGSLVAG